MRELAGEKMLSAHEVAKQLNVSRSTMQRYVASGIIKADAVGPSNDTGRSGWRYFKQETVDAFESRLNEVGWDMNKLVARQ